jgi:hypothetical protein
VARGGHPEPNALAGLWRVGLALAAVVVGAIAIWLLLSPPKHTEFAPQATTAGQTSKVSTDSSTGGTVALAIAAILLLIAANGRKITSLKFGDDEVGFALSRTAAKSTAQRATAAGLSPEQTATAVLHALDDTALRIRADGASAIDVDAIAQDAVSAARESPGG